MLNFGPQDFPGVSGRISFQSGQSRLSEIKIRQLQFVQPIRVGNTPVTPL